MSTSVSRADRRDIHIIVHSYRTNLQQLLSALSQSMTLDRRRSRTAIPTDQDQDLDTLDHPSPGSSVGRTSGNKKAEQYLKDIKKPNMHIAIHYPQLCEEYRLPVNFNVLIGEDKHRRFKKWIYSTNYRNLEKDLLMKENLRQTLRLVLANGFKEDEVATQLVKDIHKACPSLFATILPRSEQTSLEPIDDDNNELEGIVGDSGHISPSAIGCIQAK